MECLCAQYVDDSLNSFRALLSLELVLLLIISFHLLSSNTISFLLLQKGIEMTFHFSLCLVDVFENLALYC